MSDGLTINSPGPQQELSALAANQQQLRQELQALSSDVNRKFDALMEVLQSTAQQEPGSPDSPPAAATANGAQTQQPRGGVVRLAPLQQPSVGMLGRGMLSQQQPQDQRNDSIPSETTEVLALRTTSECSSPGGVFAFARRRGSSVSVGPDPGAETDSFAAHHTVKAKPNGKR
jgi:hypothetical protein